MRDAKGRLQGDKEFKSLNSALLKFDRDFYDMSHVEDYYRLFTFGDIAGNRARLLEAASWYFSPSQPWSISFEYPQVSAWHWIVPQLLLLLLRLCAWHYRLALAITPSVDDPFPELIHQINEILWWLSYIPYIAWIFYFAPMVWKWYR